MVKSCNFDQLLLLCVPTLRAQRISDAEAAQIATGVVTAVDGGSATITATCGDVSAICTVTVTEPEPEPDPDPDPDPMGIEEIPVTDIRIHPNPVGDKLTVEISGMANIGSVVILNNNGKTLQVLTLTSLKTEVDVSALPQGIYFLKAGSTVRKFIKH